MSKLHERLLKHKHMTLEEKKSCTCEICKGLNIHKAHRVEMNIRKTEIPTQNPESVDKDIKRDVV